jgi:hypothetical protein
VYMVLNPPGHERGCNYLRGAGIALEGPCSGWAGRCAGREAVLGPVQGPHHAHAGRVCCIPLQAPGLLYLDLPAE